VAEGTLVLRTHKTIGYFVVRKVVTTVWRIMFRPIVTGAHHIPVEGPVLFAPIHRSNIDFAYLIFATDRKTFFMAKHSLWKVPVIRRLIQTMGAFPVKRGTADRESMKNAETVLNAGQALVLFPEGTRQEGDVVGPLMDGAMFLALRCKVPVIPVGLGNTEKAMRKGAILPRPTRTSIVIGEPILPPDLDGRVPRSAVSDYTVMLRAGLQKAYDDARALVI
jgi:1-acyl-sn-glycerol-3-phosphate acyltransferase